MQLLPGPPKHVVLWQLLSRRTPRSCTNLGIRDPAITKAEEAVASTVEAVVAGVAVVAEKAVTGQVAGDRLAQNGMGTTEQVLELGGRIRKESVELPLVLGHGMTFQTMAQHLQTSSVNGSILWATR